VQPQGKTNKIVSVRLNICVKRNTTRSWASNEQSLVNFGDGHCALLTCCIAGVDVE